MEPAEMELITQTVIGMKGAGTLGIIIGVVQILMFALKGKLGGIAGKHRMTIVLSLTVVSGVIGLMAQDMPFLAAIMQSSVAASLQVLASQVKKQYFTDKGNK